LKAVKIPEDALIHGNKLTRYLLVRRPKNDKSGFLAQAGFTIDNPEWLEKAIRRLISENEAILDRKNEYGAFYLVEGELMGPTKTLLTVTVWIQLASDNRFHFVTLKPARK
jgi:hypothetical protein